MNKNAIQKYAVWARNELISQVKQRAYQYGISDKGCGDEYATVIAGRVLSDNEQLQRHGFVAQIKEHGYQQAVEEVAYTWFNRFVALRFMEVNDYLPSHVRVFSDASGGFNPEILKNVLHLDLPGLDKAKVSELLHANKTEELYRYLLLTQCNALKAALPEMFEKLGSYTEMLLPNNILKPDSVLGRLVTDIPEEDFRDAVQMIGWMYQYYNTEPKQAVFDGLKKNIKITKEKIPAATQLFTPDWIVRYMVENSLARLFISCKLRDARCKTEAERITKEREIAEKFGWKYYLPEAEQTPEVRAALETRNSQLTTPLSIEDIKFLDPCMGSGHILVYAFDVLMQIYESEGFNPRDAAKLILEKNLYGLDIDCRAYQLAYFALMMKARQYNRRIFTEDVKPQVYHPAGFPDGEEYGSLVKVDAPPPKPERFLEDGETYNPHYNDELRIWNFRRLLAQKYDVVVTNPPYRGASDVAEKLANFLKNEYPDSKSDLFAAFIEKCGELLTPLGFQSMITMESWMFLSSFEKLRIKLFATHTIINMVHMPYLGKGGTSLGINFGTAAFIISKSRIKDYTAQYDYICYYETDTEGTPFAFPTINERYKTAAIEKYIKIPGSPVAYWVSEAFSNAYRSKKLSEYGYARSGLQTGNNDLFLKYWYEINLGCIAFGMKSKSEYLACEKKWTPQIKGGDYRKWYGNFDYIVNWENDGAAIKSCPGCRLNAMANDELFFKEGVSWSHTTSSVYGARYLPKGHLFNVEAPTYFTNTDTQMYVLGMLNTCVAQYFLSAINSTMHYLVGNIMTLPLIESNTWLSEVNGLVGQSISISRADWDSFEISWDFICHPLLIRGTFLRGGKLEQDKPIPKIPLLAMAYGMETDKISIAFERWESFAAYRFNNLKDNEEELNRIFIDIYSLQDELNPEVEDKGVTVHCIYDRKEDVPLSLKGSNYVLTKRDVIKSFISYAVGCMFGRYSLDAEGLAYAGGEWDAGKYRSFIPDKDNILPICDDEYFDDDIVGRFVSFVKTVYGADTLEENLRYIADALGGRGTPREVIRNYFLNDFYADHCRIYQKRPIYWLFDSGKKNGFKALTYLHRYSRDLLAKLRTDYVHEQQERYRTQLSHIVSSLNTAVGAQRAQLLRQQNKLSEQLQEITVFEEKVHHLADQNIEIDLDDGVKKNYEIFADVLAKI